MYKNIHINTGVSK